MIDTDTFPTILYVMAEDFCQPGIFTGFSFAPASAEDQAFKPIRRIGGSNDW